MVYASLRHRIRPLYTYRTRSQSRVVGKEEKLKHSHQSNENNDKDSNRDALTVSTTEIVRKR